MVCTTQKIFTTVVLILSDAESMGKITIPMPGKTKSVVKLQVPGPGAEHSLQITFSSEYFCANMPSALIGKVNL